MLLLLSNIHKNIFFISFNICKFNDKTNDHSIGRISQLVHNRLVHKTWKRFWISCGAIESPFLSLSFFFIIIIILLLIKFYVIIVNFWIKI